MTPAEYVVVGSGATGATAAQTLVEGGARVLMLDGGQFDAHYAGLIPRKPFAEIRRTEPDQYRYFLGDDFEGISPDRVATGAQLTPPRQFIINEVARFLPVDSAEFSPLESLALGGLGSGWGLGCCVFSPAELAKTGLRTDLMRDAYQTVASRIGLSGAADDAQPYTFGYLKGLQPSVPLDPTAAALYANYTRRRDRIQASGFHMGRPALAVLTRDRDGRRAVPMYDMDFYYDPGEAAWRPWIVIKRLQQHATFEYRGNTVVTGFKEDGEFVTIFSIDMKTLERRTDKCRKLVLASGTLGTARIVLRSMSSGDRRLPLLCNPYSYFPCLLPSRLGKALPEQTVSFGQLVITHDPNGDQSDVALAGIYTYRSLLLFRLIRETGLNYVDARLLLRYLLSGLIIMGIHHPESYSAEKYLRLEEKPDSPTGDKLFVRYALNDEERRGVERREKSYVRMMRSIGAWAIRRVDPGLGSSIHYAGTLPFSDTEEPFHLSPCGRLRATKNVYVADGSGFSYLPAKGLTLSLMANAHVVATGLLGKTTV